MMCSFLFFVFFFKQKTAYEMRISDWSSDVCSSDLMDQAEEMARMGDRDQARDMLQQMQRMLEAMKNGKLARMPEGRQPGQRGQRGQGGQGQMIERKSVV